MGGKDQGGAQPEEEKAISEATNEERVQRKTRKKNKKNHREKKSGMKKKHFGVKTD